MPFGKRVLRGGCTAVLGAAVFGLTAGASTLVVGALVTATAPFFGLSAGIMSGMMAMTGPLVMGVTALGGALGGVTGFFSRELNSPRGHRKSGMSFEEFRRRRENGSLPRFTANGGAQMNRQAVLRHKFDRMQGQKPDAAARNRLTSPRLPKNMS